MSKRAEVASSTRREKYAKVLHSYQQQYEAVLRVNEVNATLAQKKKNIRNNTRNTNNNKDKNEQSSLLIIEEVVVKCRGRLNAQDMINYEQEIDAFMMSFEPMTLEDALLDAKLLANGTQAANEAAQAAVAKMVKIDIETKKKKKQNATTTLSGAKLQPTRATSVNMKEDKTVVVKSLHRTLSASSSTGSNNSSNHIPSFQKLKHTSVIAGSTTINNSFGDADYDDADAVVDVDDDDDINDDDDDDENDASSSSPTISSQTTQSKGSSTNSTPLARSTSLASMFGGSSSSSSSSPTKNSNSSSNSNSRSNTPARSNSGNIKSEDKTPRDDSSDRTNSGSGVLQDAASLNPPSSASLMKKLREEGRRLVWMPPERIFSELKSIEVSGWFIVNYQIYTYMYVRTS
jgi:hypothetical protein